MIAILMAVLLQGWEPMVNVPTPMGAGASMASCKSYVYLVPGGGTSEFWAYAPVTNEWLRCDDVPYPVAAGGSMTADSEFIYVLADSHVCRYILTENRWTELAVLPEPAGTGAAIVFGGSGLFVLRGGNSTKMWKLTGDAWTLLSLSYIAGTGTAVVRISDNLHFLRGVNSDDRLTYNIPSGMWPATSPLPDPVSGGSAMASMGNRLCIFRGASSTGAFLVDTITDTVTPWIDAPVVCKSGTAMASRGGTIYAAFGGSTAFYRILVEKPVTLPTATLPVVAPITVKSNPVNHACGGTAGGSFSWMVVLPLLLVAGLRYFSTAS